MVVLGASGGGQRRSPVYPTTEEELRRVCGAAVYDELAADSRRTGMASDQADAAPDDGLASAVSAPHHRNVADALAGSDGAAVALR